MAPCPYFAECFKKNNLFYQQMFLQFALSKVRKMNGWSASLCQIMTIICEEIWNQGRVKLFSLIQNSIQRPDSEENCIIGQKHGLSHQKVSWHPGGMKPQCNFVKDLAPCPVSRGIKQGCLVCSICLRLSLKLDRKMEDEPDWKRRGWPSPAVQLGAAVKHICVSMWSSLQLHSHCKTMTARSKMCCSLLQFCFKTLKKAAQILQHIRQIILAASKWGFHN